MVWTKNQEHVINTHLSVYSEAGNCFYCWVPKGFDPKKFMHELAEIKSKGGDTECFFSISLQRANVFFKTRFLGFDHAGLQFKIPDKVFKVQRRRDLRFPIPDGLSLKVEFDDPLSPDVRSTRKVIDLSASGMAFQVNEDEIPMYPSGFTLQNLSFSVRSKKITVAAEIRHTRKLGSDSRLKGAMVGILFKDIRPGDSQHIAGYVFEESRKYFSRFI